MSNQLHIIEGFADGLSDLNNQVVSDSMTATPAGRAYKSGETAVYANEVHIHCIGEDTKKHLSLEKKFDRHPGRYAGNVYMGAAGLLNLGFIAATKPAAAVLYDLNMVQTIFWNDVIRALAENPDVEDFIQFLKQEQQELPIKLSGIFNESAALKPYSERCLAAKTAYRLKNGDIAGWLDEGRQKLMADRYWMHQGYEHLHLLAKHNAIGAITLDVTDEKACAQLKEYLDKKGVRVGMLYISNIFNFLHGNTDFSNRRLRNATHETARKNLKQLLKGYFTPVIHEAPKWRLTWPSRIF